MSVPNEFKGCKVIIYGEKSGRVICETTVIEYDRKNVTIKVYASKIEDNSCEHVLLLILHPKAIYEFKGTIRDGGARGYHSIALFQGKEKEDRTSKRYIVNIPAKVENLVIADRLLPLPVPKEVFVVDISTEGVLVRTMINTFNIGTIFQLKLMISGSMTEINTSVVRINKIDEKNAEYGCKFNYLYQ